MRCEWLSNCYRFIIVLIFAVIIEILYFNRMNVLAIIIGQEKELSGDSIVENQPGEIFILNDDMKIYNVVVSCHTGRDLSFSYLKPNGIVDTVPMNSMSKDTFYLKLGRDVLGTTVIRGDYEEKYLGEMSVVFNKKTLMISPWRIMAMVSIYYIGSFLFSLQKMPDYSKLIIE